MKYLLSFCFLFSLAYAQNLPQQYTELLPEIRQKYDQQALEVKPKLTRIENAVLTVATDEAKSAQARLIKLTAIQNKLELWVGNSVLKYTIMLPLLNTVQAQREALASLIPFKVPYRPHQISAQFNVNGAQLYALGKNNLTLVRGHTQSGRFMRNQKVLVYFKQRGPVLSKIREIVSSPKNSTETFILDNQITLSDFLGGAVLIIPQP